MAEQLTLLSLGVDLDALARRISLAQERAGLADAGCAATAGVTEERWRSWKSGTERPGVARMPKIAEAVKAPVGWLMYDADPGAAIERTDTEIALNRSRRAAALLAEAIPLVEAIARLADEVERERLPMVEGITLATSLKTSAKRFHNNNAVSAMELPL